MIKVVLNFCGLQFIINNVCDNFTRWVGVRPLGRRLPYRRGQCWVFATVESSWLLSRSNLRYLTGTWRALPHNILVQCAQKQSGRADCELNLPDGLALHLAGAPGALPIPRIYFSHVLRRQSRPNSDLCAVAAVYDVLHGSDPVAHRFRHVCLQLPAVRDRVWTGLRDNFDGRSRLLCHNNDCYNHAGEKQ